MLFFPIIDAIVELISTSGSSTGGVMSIVRDETKLPKEILKDTIKHITDKECFIPEDLLVSGKVY